MLSAVLEGKIVCGFSGKERGKGCTSRLFFSGGWTGIGEEWAGGPPMKETPQKRAPPLPGTHFSI